MADLGSSESEQTPASSGYWPTGNGENARDNDLDLDRDRRRVLERERRRVVQNCLVSNRTTVERIGDTSFSAMFWTSSLGRLAKLPGFWLSAMMIVDCLIVGPMKVIAIVLIAMSRNLQ